MHMPSIKLTKKYALYKRLQCPAVQDTVLQAQNPALLPAARRVGKSSKLSKSNIVSDG
jgi:hypothetical protein